MTISGMTGFASVRGTHAGIGWAWEAKSVNGRGLDVRVRLPVGHEALEEIARKEAAVRFSRGSIQLNLSLESSAPSIRYRINETLLQELIERCGALVERGRVAPPTLDGLLTIKGVLEPEQEHLDETASKALASALTNGLVQVLHALDDARRHEGQTLHGLLSNILETIARCTSDARTVSDAQPAELSAKLRQKLDELLSGTGIDQARLAQEAALLALKADVREELDRLDAHVIEARKLLASEGAQGRRLDFLAQEFNREANTLCSKSASTGLTRIGLDMKAAIDQLREQAQNVE